MILVSFIDAYKDQLTMPLVYSVYSEASLCLYRLKYSVYAVYSTMYLSFRDMLRMSQNLILDA